MNIEEAYSTFVPVTAAAIGALVLGVYTVHRACEAIARRRRGPSLPSVPRGATEHPTLPTGHADVAYKHYRLLIVRCTDPLMWYAGMVGKEVLYLGTWKDDGLHKSREPAGFVNIVRPIDAIIIKRVTSKEPK